MDRHPVGGEELTRGEEEEYVWVWGGHPGVFHHRPYDWSDIQDESFI